MKLERNGKLNLLQYSIALASIVVTLLLLPRAANAQPIGATLGGQPLFGIFYEDGRGFINGVFQQAFADPLSGAPTWILPYSVVAGDVLATEPGPGGPAISDVLRFPNVAGGVSDRVLLFSDLDPDSPGDMADVGLPPVLQPNQITVPEINGFIDYDVPGGVVDYHVFSEVPEPSSLALGVLALGSLFLRRRPLRS